MADKYTLRRLPDGEPTSEQSLDVIEMRLGGRLLATSAPWEVRVDLADPRQHQRMLGVLARVDAAFRDGKAERIVVRPEDGSTYAIKRRAAKPSVPVIDTPGTTAIDRIYTAVHAKFDAEFEVRDMGICVAKPGEHGHCNAWDGGTTVGASADVVHPRILKMATFLREQGLKHQEDPTTGLPVFGVIVLDKFWKRGMGRTWGKYTGTFHAIHFHVAGNPSFTGHI